MLKYLFILFVFIVSLSFGQTIYKPKDSTNYFIMHYEYLTPDSVKNIINKTTLQISRFINTTININVNVEWISEGALIEASCHPTSYEQNFKNCSHKNVLYAIALAEKLSETEINSPTDPDILMTINRDMTWYFGDDGKPSSSQVDLYTILLHEICHGLGFVTNFTQLDNIGYLNGLGLPFIFDTFITDSKGNHLIDSTIFENNSESLSQALISDSLYFSGPYVTVMTNNKNARLYAPTTFKTGSSIEHLNDNTYPKGNINSLLNHGKAPGESIHKLGPILEGMLADIGWTDSLLSVNVLHDNENLNYTPKVFVYANSVFDPSSITLHYSYDNFQTGLTVVFSKTDTANYYSAYIPSIPFGHTVSYYVTASDISISKNSVGIPINQPSNFYSFYIGKDTIKPILLFSPFSTIYNDQDTLYINAQATDNIGVDSVWFAYLISSTDTAHVQKVLLHKLFSDEYTGFILLKNKITLNDFLLYKLYAIDSSLYKNVSETKGNDISGFYFTKISPDKTPYVSFEDNFQDTLFSQQKMTLNGFYITKSVDLDTLSLQTKHPYPTALYKGLTRDLTATLINPCIIRNTNAYMDFDEVVLVEPADANAVYGDYSFWDYCIIEGSKDQTNWYAFEQEGYKTELFPDWLQTYYSNTFTDNFGKLSSLATPTNKLYHHHTINLLGNKYLRKGDEVFIRFRLFSDAYTNGWGWAINNLKIQTSKVNIPVLTNSFLIYPTISTSNTFTVSHSDDVTLKNIEVYSMLGIKSDYVFSNVNANQCLITIHGNSGVYFIKVMLENGTIETRKIILLTNSNE
jgi:hypothetical protein